ncbi:unnamed protein product [Polarella glacialis]|uniref:Uncharacterized protein n=1 Tax=Polarella glacialis TaxID=89957 RepID=A0A813HX82_POLGL|nr:unnamed protein product [Polarella glacialis]
MLLGLFCNRKRHGGCIKQHTHARDPSTPGWVSSEVGKACDPDDSSCAAGGLGVTRKCSCKFLMAGFPANGPNGELNCWVCFNLFVVVVGGQMWGAEKGQIPVLQQMRWLVVLFIVHCCRCCCCIFCLWIQSSWLRALLGLLQVL